MSRRGAPRAVAVVGVATVGASVAVANSKGKPVPNAAVLTVVADAGADTVEVVVTP